MSKIKSIVVVFYLTLGFLSGELILQCRLVPSPRQALAAFNRISNGKIIEIDGEGEIKRQDGRILMPQLGTQLYPGDQLQITSESQLVVLCSDLSVQIIGANSTTLNQCSFANTEKPDPNLCHPDTNCPHRGDDLKIWNRENIPYIISPQKTQILNPQPILHWGGVPAPTKYTVSLRENGQEIWRVSDIVETQIQYPGEPPLKPGNIYQVIVETDTGISSRDVVVPGGVEFQLLQAETVEVVQSEVAKIQAQGLAPESEKLAIATLYENYQLFAEAVELLETLVHTEKSAPIYKKLGDLYWLTWELAPVAKPYYLQAIESAHLQDLETLIFAKDGLGQIEVALGNRGKALELFREVKAGYQQLGEIEQMEEVEKQIQDLELEN